MARIDSEQKFRAAAAQWLAGRTPQGVWFVDAGERRIFDETPDPTPESPGRVRYAEVTPATPVLEAALDVALVNAAADTALETAQSVALTQAKVYLRNQLRTVNPDTTVIVPQIKNYVDNNTTLVRMLTNQVNLMNAALGWTLDLNPLTAQSRTRYLLAVEAVIGLIA